MIEILLEVGTLLPPACYASEQERAEAIIAATTATITSDAEWHVGQLAPTNTDLYWLQLDVDGRPKTILKYFVDDAAWVRVQELPTFSIATGAAGAYASTNLPPYTTPGTAYITGKAYVFKANHANTGASTYDVDGMGPKAIKIKVTQPTVLGSILIDQIVTVVYDGLNFQMISAVGGAIVEAGDIVAGVAGQFLRTREVATVPTTVWELSLYRTASAGFEAIPADGANVTFPHLLGAQPLLYGVDFVCNDAGGNCGYSLNDTVPVELTHCINSTNDDEHVGVWANATEVGFVCPVDQTTSSFNLKHKTTGVRTVMDRTKWKLAAWAMI